jgi:subtilisin family serine protease
LYVVKDLSRIAGDPKVLSFKSHDTPKLLNRYTVGLLQSGDQMPKFEGGRFWISRPFYSMNLTGAGQIVGVVDSGLDVQNCFFRDPVRDCPFDRTDPTHRKVVRYDAVADRYDPKFGHGTHVCGIIAGNALCSPECGLSLYNGVAPDARIYMHDLGKLENGPGDLGDIEVPFFMNQMKEVDAYISSNSWGYPSGHEESRRAFSEAAWENPDITFVFACGNLASPLTINTPANSKNVLAVGAVEAPLGASLERADRRIVTVSTRMGKTYVGTNVWPELWDLMRGDTIRSFAELPLIEYSESKNPKNYSNSVVFMKDEKKCEAVKEIEEQGGVVILAKDKIQCQGSSKDKIRVLVANNMDRICSGQETVTIGLEATGTPGPLARMSLSSQGPSDLGYMKPEIVVPGSVTSASAGDPKKSSPRSCSVSELHVKSGTSMAAPSVSGVVAIVRQYFTEGWYPENTPHSGESIIPSSMLIRAVIMNSATPISTSIATGYGLPCLSDALGFSRFGLRFTDRQVIGPKQTMKFRIRTQKIATLAITLCYLDPPLSEDSVNPLFADLDLIVVTPDQRRLLGNGLEDQFATSERVVITDAEPGEYLIYVMSSAFAEDIEIPFSIVANGGFASALPYLMAEDVKDCPFGCGSGKCVNGLCDCGKDAAGLFCSEPVTRIARESFQVAKVKFKKVMYYSFVMSDDNFTLRIKATSNKEKAVVCLQFGGRPTKIADPESVCVRSADGGAFVLNVTEEDLDGMKSGSEIYLAVFGLTGGELSVSFAIDNLDPGFNIVSRFSALPLSVKVILGMATAIVLGIAIGVGFILALDKYCGNNQMVLGNRSENSIPPEELDQKVRIVVDDEMVLA